MNLDMYQRISSPDNGQIKLLEKLQAKKFRTEFRLFSVENLTIILDALKDGYSFQSLFVTEEFLTTHQEQMAILEAGASEAGLYLITERLNKQYSLLDTTSGITAIYEMTDRELDNSSVIYLNGLSDPGNLGTIMRSALAFNFTNLVLDANCVDIYNPKVIAAAKDAFFKLNTMVDKSGDWFKKNQLPLYVTSSHEGTNLAEFKPSQVFCLVLGSESQGVSQELMNKADAKIKISMSDRLESLNVATAAAILLYELSQ